MRGGFCSCGFLEKLDGFHAAVFLRRRGVSTKIFTCIPTVSGHPMEQLLEALRYKPEVAVAIADELIKTSH